MQLTRKRFVQGTAAAGGEMPWGSWITCEEIFNYGSTEGNMTVPVGAPHGYAFEIAADASGPVQAVPIKAAGRFAREAVAWLEGSLYQTEDRGNAAFYRYTPDEKPRQPGGDPTDPPPEEAAYTYAIWGPFERVRRDG